MPFFKKFILFSSYMLWCMFDLKRRQLGVPKDKETEGKNEKKKENNEACVS